MIYDTNNSHIINVVQKYIVVNIQPVQMSPQFYDNDNNYVKGYTKRYIGTAHK